MKTHTTLDLDRDLLAAAAEALGTSRTTDTVHAALREAVARSARARLMARDWSNLKELLPGVRAPRAFLPQPGETAVAIADAARARTGANVGEVEAQRKRAPGRQTLEPAVGPVRNSRSRRTSA
jgi:Arc/MetJ family transcription regulator